MVFQLATESNNNNNINNPFTTITTEMFARVEFLATYLVIAHAAATQSLTSGSIHEFEGDNDPEWRFKTGNFSVPKAHTPAFPKRSMDCNLSLPKRSNWCSALETRDDDDAEVKVLVYEDSVVSYGRWNLKKDEVMPLSPPGFTNLWNDVVTASCNIIECGSHVGKAKTAQYFNSRPGTLNMWLEGDYWNETIRDEMVAVLRQAFDKAVVREYFNVDYAMYEWGPKDLFARHKGGDSLRMVMRTESESEDGCGDIVSRILELGGLVSPLFGIVSVGCATADM